MDDLEMRAPFAVARSRPGDWGVPDRVPIEGTVTGAAVSVVGVDKSFRRRGQRTHALSRVDLNVAPGELVSLLGPSGCGKSTLLRTIGGLIDVDAGTISVDGVGPAVARREKRFGLVPQAPALVPWLNVEDNVTFLATLHRHRGVRRVDSGGPLSAHEVDELIRAVGLDQFRKAWPHELSGGMQQRASLVRGFALGAPVLLMDEPFAALDEITRADARYLLLDLWTRTGATVVFVTHSIPEAVILSDRVVVMAPRPGRVAAIETIELPRPRTPDMEDDPAFHDHVRRLRAVLRETST